MNKILKFNYIGFLYLLSILFFSEISFAISNIDTSKELEVSTKNINIITDFFTVDLLFNIIFAIITIILTVIISKIVESKLTRYLENTYAGEAQGRQELVGVLTRSVNIAILSIGAGISLTILGVDMGIFLGGLGFGIGFTLKIFLTNFVSGILMVTQGFYHVGDIIKVGGRTGKILNIHALFTVLEQFDGVVFYIPNVKFLEEDVTNYNSNDKRRVEIIIGVDYNTDILKAKKIMLQVTKQFPNILQAPYPEVYMDKLDTNAIKLKLKFWISSTDGYIDMKSNVTETLNFVFKQAGIVIPLPQLVLHSKEKFSI